VGQGRIPLTNRTVSEDAHYVEHLDKKPHDRCQIQRGLKQAAVDRRRLTAVD